MIFVSVERLYHQQLSAIPKCASPLQKSRIEMTHRQKGELLEVDGFFPMIIKSILHESEFLCITVTEKRPHPCIPPNTLLDS